MSNVLVALSGPALAAVGQVVKSVGATLGRPVGVVDRQFNQLARSAPRPPHAKSPLPCALLAPDSDLPVRELLGADIRARQRAVRRALEEQPYAANLGVVALVVAGVEDSGGLRSQSLGDAARGYAFRLVAEDHICLLIPGRPSDSDVVADRLAAQVDGVVGIGQWYPHLRFAHESYQEALGAARAAARLADLGRVVRWAALGVYRTFVHLSEGALAHCSIHPALERLFTEPAHQQLLVTLETYLDLAGNVPLAAQRLHLHRASLYYRLRRVQELLQADLRDGHERLCLHMAFKLGRFTGRYPLPHATAAGGRPPSNHVNGSPDRSGMDSSDSCQWRAYAAFRRT